jgi:DNA helicase-2/ATP-dependent DNA helicase PcrA
MFEQFLAKKTVPKEWQEIQKYTLLRIDDGMLPYEDVPPFLYFQGILQGYPIRRDIKHLVIDEAQDYTILQFKILTMIFPNTTWTVVGDSAQSIHPFLDTPSFKEMSEIIGIEKSHTFCLTRSYRSTKQIQSFCQAMLSEKIKVEPINRIGPLPTVIRIENVQNLVPALIDTIESILNEGWHSIGIICKNMSESIQIFSSIKEHVNLNLIIEEDDEFHRGIVVIPSYLAKGLEFDGVLVINADESNYSRDEERHILYTVCTRSLHRLSLFYIGVLSPFLQEIDKNLYQAR